MVSEVKRLNNELRKYKNENTPSSANKHLKGNTYGLHTKGGKRGAPVGHEGITREQKQEEFNEVGANECPNCRSTDLEDVSVLKRVTEKIPVPVTPKVTETLIHKKRCRNCGKTFIPPQNTVPLEGKFGVNLMVLILMMKLLLRGVLRKTASFLEYWFAFSITPASVNSVIKRAADAAGGEYKVLKERIRSATKVHVDETSFSVLGINWWLWVFTTDADTLIVVRKSRGQDPIRGILGGDYAGIVICDCWRAYDFLARAIIQRCWAHLLRKGKALESVRSRHFYSRLCGMFAEIERFNASDPTDLQRAEKCATMTARLEEIVEYYGRYDDTKPVANYISNHFDQWLNCIRYKDIEPTNNLAEKAVRESVMYRKIIGAFGSVDGAAYYERLASLFATWQKRGLDLQVELKRMLTSNLCLS